MPDNARRFRLGLFVLGSGLLFVGLLAFILHNSFGRARAVYYILFTANVKGMVVGSRVNFQGVPIGVVADMRFQDGKTLVELQVDPTRANLQDVTRARMDRLLVTGQVTVELEGYGPQGRSLPPGSFIQPKEDPLQALTGSLPGVVDQAAVVLTRLDRVLAGAEALLGDDNRTHLTSMLAAAERAAQQLADGAVPAATALLEETRVAVAEARVTASAARDAVGAVARLEHDLRGLLRETTALAAGVRGPAQTALAGVRTTLDDLRGLLRQLRLAPDSLLFGVAPPAAPAGGNR